MAVRQRTQRVDTQMDEGFHVFSREAVLGRGAHVVEGVVMGLVIVAGAG